MVLKWPKPIQSILEHFICSFCTLARFLVFIEPQDALYIRKYSLLERSFLSNKLRVISCLSRCLIFKVLSDSQAFFTFVFRFRFVRRSLWRLTIIPNHTKNVNTFFQVFLNFFEKVVFCPFFRGFLRFLRSLKAKSMLFWAKIHLHNLFVEREFCF